MALDVLIGVCFFAGLAAVLAIPWMNIGYIEPAMPDHSLHAQRQAQKKAQRQARKHS